MNRLRFLMTTTAAFFYAASFAQTGALSLDKVPENVKKDAAVIVHLDETNLDVESLDKATLRVHRIYTVMNEEGRHELRFRAYSSKDQTLEDVELKVMDAFGKTINKFKKKDMQTTAIGEGLIEDGYVTYVNISTPTYPVTVEYSYQHTYKGTLFIPDFHIISLREGVSSAVYTARIPASLNLRYKSKHIDIKPDIRDDGKFRTYNWSVNNIAPIDLEEGSESVENVLPVVDIVLDQFSYYGFQGDLSTWKSFGNWVNTLYSGLDELPAERVKFFQSLTSTAPNENEKIRRVYDYLQQNFRYVSIQLGVGGWKPFSASFTDQKKYGDCKALSNYMKAALKAIGITSYVAVINAEFNKPPVDPDFPSSSFNHAILCVPHQKDSIWLECTSSTAEFAQLGTFTENRNALLITENGGVLVSTPRSNASTNRLGTKNITVVDESGAATTHCSVNATGEFNELTAELLKLKRDEQKEAIMYVFGFKQPDEFTYTALTDKHENEISFKTRKVSEFNSGDKYFLKARAGKLWSGKLPAADSRTQDYFFHFPFEKSDTTVFRLPANFKLDALPTDKNLSNKYASYHSRSWYNEAEHSVYTATTLNLYAYHIPAKDFKIVKSFFDDVLQDDTQRLVIKKTADAPPVQKTF